MRLATPPAALRDDLRRLADLLSPHVLAHLTPAEANRLAALQVGLILKRFDLGLYEGRRPERGRAAS
jgi:hypothetical protein